MTEIEADEATVKKQLTCSHSFIRRSIHEPYRCPHCGITEKQWDDLQAMRAAMMWP